MAMFEKAVLANKDAEAFINNLRMEICGYAKVYTARYMRRLAEICGYQVWPVAGGYCWRACGVVHTRKTPREVGQIMESKINDLFAFGILKA